MIEEMAEVEAAVAILHAGGEPGSVLLIRRAEREGDPWSGHWSFPGGRRDPCDGDALDTAIRELEEECGIRLAREDARAALPLALARHRVGRYLVVAPYLFDAGREFAVTLDPREAVDALWAPLAVLRDPARHALRTVPGRPWSMRFPTVPLDHIPLWGFTYRLIADWLELTPRRVPSEAAGFEAASGILDFLRGCGLAVERDWELREVRETPGPPSVRAAVVAGPIPDGRVLEFCATPGLAAARVNALEVRPDFIRVTGLGYEEYLIEAE